MGRPGIGRSLGLAPPGFDVLTSKTQSALRRKAEEQRLSGLAKLRSTVEGEKGITDTTRKELLQGLEGDVSPQKAAEISQTLEKAKEGLEPKFAARKQQERIKTLLTERPGRRQTVLTR